MARFKAGDVVSIRQNLTGLFVKECVIRIDSVCKSDRSYQVTALKPDEQSWSRSQHWDHVDTHFDKIFSRTKIWMKLNE